MGFHEVLKPISDYWFIIVAIAAFFHYYYRKEMTKYEDWQNEYFENILVPFHLQCLKSFSFDVSEFIDSVQLLNKAFVPSYLHYLACRNEYDKFKEVVLVDYEKYNPSLSDMHPVK